MHKARGLFRFRLYRRLYDWRDRRSVHQGQHSHRLYFWLAAPLTLALLIWSVGLMATGAGPTPSVLFLSMNPNASGTIAVFGLVALVATFLWWRAIRHRATFPQHWIIGAWMVWSLVVGIWVYLPKQGGEAFFFSALHSAVILFVGMVNNPWTAADPEAVLPLGVQVVRLSAVTVFFSAVLATAMSLGRRALVRRRVKYSRQVILVTGLSERTLPVIEALVNSNPAESDVVVLARAPRPSLITEVEAVGGHVLLGGISSEERDLHVLSQAVFHGVRKRRLALKAAYLLGDHDATNIEAARVVARVIAAGTAAPDPAGIPPRVIVRIDHLRMAMDFLRRSITDNPNVLMDTTGLPQVTAKALVAQVMPGATSVYVAGDSDLTQAFLLEMALTRNFEQFKRTIRQEAGPGAEPRVFVAGPNAESVKARQQTLREQYGFTKPLLNVWSEPLEEIPSEMGTRIVLTGEPVEHQELLVENLADRLPDSGALVFYPDEKLHRVATTTLMGNLRPYGMTLTLPREAPQPPVSEEHSHPLPWFARALRSLSSHGRQVAATSQPRGTQMPDDTWTQIARLAHEAYCVRQRACGKTVQPWSQLRESLRRSNYRMVARFFELARRCDRTWLPVAAGDSAEVKTTFDPLTDEELKSVAEFEHQSWLRQMRAEGWVYGPEKCSLCRVNPNLVEWDPENVPGHMEWTKNSLADTQKLLASLGYRPRRLVWQKYVRSGIVQAQRVTRAETWQAHSGDVLHAQAGDWWIRDDEGRHSITDAEFHDTYRPVSQADTAQPAGQEWTDGTYERTGLVEAREGMPGEVIRTTEGVVGVTDGDMVVRRVGNVDVQWVAQRKSFARYNTPYEAPPTADGHEASE